jgi:hypothetical protein
LLKDEVEAAALGRGKGGNDASWADANLTGPKNEENPRDRFSWYEWRDLKQQCIIFLKKYMQVRSSFIHLIA